MTKKLFSALLAEFIGVFLLTFIDCGIDTLNLHSSDPVPLLGRSLAPALTIMALIFSFGEISGAHFNPAVTFAFLLRGVFPWRRALVYVGVQLTGAAFAALVLFIYFGSTVHAGVNLPKDSDSICASLEFFMTGFLVLTILATACEGSLKGPEVAFPVGFTLLVCGLLGKSLTGASLNPARSFGPALVTLDFGSYWIYSIMPITGAALGVILTWLTKGGPSKKESKAARGEN